MAELVRTGSCLCGAIKIRTEGENLSTHLCHCITCKKITGSAFGSSAVFKDDQVTLTPSSPEVLRLYEDINSVSGKVNNLWFCGKCGSPVRTASSGFKGFVVVPIGILDGDNEDLKPRSEFFCIRKASWLGSVESSAQFDALPQQPGGDGKA
ncbi:Mss4-like protein [Xylariales sp. PMI_506]|nr:Mss4-like protein [Xylariales sp. PMI_506]